jgi:hypothetical protein
MPAMIWRLQPIREILMQYLLLIYDAEKNWATMPEAEMKKMYAAYGVYTKELIASGAMQGGSELAPIANATTVRMRNGKVATTDGPFAETKEQLGGYYLIDVPNIDEAIKWAARIPSVTHGAIEVRPLVGGPSAQ